MKSSPKKSEALTAATGRASSVQNQVLTQGVDVSDSTEVATNRAITVPFHGAELYVVEHNGQPFTPMKPIVQGMELDWKSQHRKLASNRARWGVVEITIPESNLHHHDGDTDLNGHDDHAGQRRRVTCLPIRKVAGWLSTIDAGRVKSPEARAKVIQYQNECDDVLWQYWNEGIAINARASQPEQAVLDYARITPAQAQDLKQIVQAIVDAGIQKYAETWARLQRKFKVHSYLALHPDQYEDARGYLIAKLPNGYTEAGPDALLIESTEDSIKRLTQQLESSDDATAADLMPLVHAVLRKQGLDPIELVAESRGALPADQVKEITDRLYRLGQLFNPLSAQFADVLGIRRALLGLHPDLGMQQNGFRQVIPLLTA